MAGRSKPNGDKVSLRQFYEMLLEQNKERTEMEARLKQHLDDKLDTFTNGHIKRLDGRVDDLQKESRVAAAITATGAILLGLVGVRYP